MTRSTVRMRQVMDISAAVWAGMIAGLIFLLIQIFISTTILNGSIWMPFYWNSAILLGQYILLPPIEFSFGFFLLGLMIHLVIAVVFSLLIAFIIHRGGLWLGIIGGGLMGLIIYGLNFYAFQGIFPWFYVVRGIGMALAHVAFGAIAGGVYEGLEVEDFEPVEA